MSTVGGFLAEKMLNMRNWLVGEGYPLDALYVSETQATMFAQHLAKLDVESKQFDIFSEQDDERIMPLVLWIEQRPHLHNKFWRYLTLFSDTVINE